MKKLFLAAVAAASVFTASAQTTFGIKGGVNFANVQVSQEGTSATASAGSLTTFSAGVFADAPLGTGGFSLQPGVFYTGKGFSGSNDDLSAKLKLFYVQVPVNVVYNVPISAGKFFFGAGPYVAFGVNGKSEARQTAGGPIFSDDVTFGNDNGSDIKRTEFGATGLAGFRFTNGLSLNVNYDLGLSNIIPGENLGGSLKNRVFGISLGYSFK
jgi:hypothetical protein